jgi:hypothetical protein
MGERLQELAESSAAASSTDHYHRHHIMPMQNHPSDQDLNQAHAHIQDRLVALKTTLCAPGKSFQMAALELLSSCGTGDLELRRMYVFHPKMQSALMKCLEVTCDCITEAYFYACLTSEKSLPAF